MSDSYDNHDRRTEDPHRVCLCPIENQCDCAEPVGTVDTSWLDAIAFPPADGGRCPVDVPHERGAETLAEVSPEVAERYGLISPILPPVDGGTHE